MRIIIAFGSTISLVSMLALFDPASAGETPSVDAAWQALPTYQYGQDVAPLLAIDRAVIQSRASSQARAALAARLAAVLESPQATPAARQYVCVRLRDVGTAAEVPLLAALLKDPAMSDMARGALESIPDRAAAEALRAAMSALPNDLVVGVVNSVGARRDVEAVPKLEELAQSADERVRKAALDALGTIGTEAAAAFLKRRADAEKVPTPAQLAVPLLRAAASLDASGKADKAKEIYTHLSREGQDRGIRRAALEGLLRREGDQAAAVLAWFTGNDPQRQLVAASRLDRIPTDRLEALAREPATPEAARFALVEVLASRKAQNILPLVMSMAKGGDPALRAFGIRALGSMGDATAVPFLIESLGADPQTVDAAEQALSKLPRKVVNPALLAALQNRPQVRPTVIEVLIRVKCYEAIEPLLGLAASDDPAVYGPAMDGLRGIADPDKTDLPRLLRLVARVPRGLQRDEAEKTVMLVCGKLPPGADRAEPVLALLAKNGFGDRADFLPLLGRLGGPKALAALKAAVSDRQPQVRDAAIRALCNWPNAEVADQLLEIAGRCDDPAQRRSALRAYVRVVTLKSDRTTRETLAMLEQAMKLASYVEDQRLILSRVGTMRDLEAVEWLAKRLDDPELRETACAAILEATHDRSLRSTNQERLAPIFEKIGRVSADPAVRDRVKQYQLGL